MPTVIVGGGIIGASTAYYLSTISTEDEDIHIIDSSSQLFNGASGYAAGFLAKDWFSPSVAQLGELSFSLHRELAEKNDGFDRWGYMKGVAFSLDTTTAASYYASGNEHDPDDWLREGTSRAEVSGHSRGTDSSVRPPAWLTKQKGGIVQKISSLDTVAQV